MDDQPKPTTLPVPPRVVRKKPVSGGEYPSGLRDAISRAHFGHAYRAGRFDAQIVDRIADGVVAWLSVVSEEERAAAARAICAARAHLVHDKYVPCSFCTQFADAALGAARGVLLPKETP